MSQLSSSSSYADFADARNGRGPDPGQFVADAMFKAGILDPDTARAYGSLFSRFMRERNSHLDWHKITPPPRERVIDYSLLEQCPHHEPLQQELLNKVAIVKLNGGWAAAATAITHTTRAVY